MTTNDIIQYSLLVKGGGGGPRQHFWEDQFQALGTAGAPYDIGNFW